MLYLWNISETKCGKERTFGKKKKGNVNEQHFCQLSSISASQLKGNLSFFCQRWHLTPVTAPRQCAFSLSLAKASGSREKASVPFWWENDVQFWLNCRYCSIHAHVFCVHQNSQACSSAFWYGCAACKLRPVTFDNSHWMHFECHTCWTAGVAKPAKSGGN